MTENATRSAAHRWVERLLDRNGLSYLSEAQEFAPYQLDIYLPEWHLCVEVDGPQHGPKRDSKRDSYLLENYAMPTLRIKTTVRHWKSDVLDRILFFIAEHAETTPERKASWRDKR